MKVKTKAKDDVYARVNEKETNYTKTCAKPTLASKYVFRMKPLNWIFFHSFIEIHTEEIVFKYSSP